MTKFINLNKKVNILAGLFLGVFALVGVLGYSPSVHAQATNISGHGGVNLQPSGKATLNTETGMVEYKYVLQAEPLLSLNHEFTMNSVQVYLPKIEGAEFSAKLLGYPDESGVYQSKEVQLTDKVSENGKLSNDMVNYGFGYISDANLGDDYRGSMYPNNINSHLNTYNFALYNTPGVTAYELTYSIPLEIAKEVKYMPSFAMNSWMCNSEDSYWGYPSGCNPWVASTRDLISADNSIDQYDRLSNGSVSDLLGKMYDYKTITDDYVDSNGQLIKNIGGIYDSLIINQDTNDFSKIVIDNAKETSLVEILRLGVDDGLTYNAAYDDYADEAVSMFAWEEPKNEVVNKEQTDNTQVAIETPKVSAPNTGVQSNAAIYIISIVGITIFAAVISILKKSKLN